MTTHADFEAFLRLLEEHRVEYMIVGGFAVAYHGFPRFTKDIDVFDADLADNALKPQAALVAFGFDHDSVAIDILQRPDSGLSIGLEPVRIDLLNRIAGVTFADARPLAVRGRYGKVAVWFIGKEDLLRNKRATGRQRDLGDVAALT